jgi:plasmid stability protein
MKTTLDLPQDVVRELKLRAVSEGRKLKDLAADILRSGLEKDPPNKLPKTPVVVKDKRTGLPVIQCLHAASRQEELTPERAANILMQQEVDHFRDSA